MIFLMRTTVGLVLSMLIGLSSVNCFNDQTTAQWIWERTGVNIGELIEVDSWDNHHEVECGGLFRPYPDHYDGDSLDVFECDREAFSQIEGQWQLLPLTENLNRVIYGDYADSKPCIPEIKNGYYLFVDRHDDADDPSDDGPLFDRTSIDLSLFIYDTDREMLYYYEYDT